ncbi:MAG: glycosyltransferase [Chitinophagaceae bacterium]|nr:glycosyltransferase [Chitinophagaceae bacterium]
MKVAVCTHFNRFQVKHNVFFPLYRWEKLLRHHGVLIDFKKSFDPRRFQGYDTVIIHDRYFRAINGFSKVNEKVVFSKQQFIDFMGTLKQQGQKVILYDGFDPVGCLFFEFIPFVDKLVKKQIYKDLHKYAENNKSLSVRPYADNPDYFMHDDYVPCPQEHLHKIGLAWNIGLTDLRRGEGWRGVLNNYFFEDYAEKPIPYEQKTLVTSFRGTGTGKKTKSSQRNRLIEILKQMNKPGIVTGNPIKFKDYIKELGNCKALVSPFGGGELCYRDFEIFAQQSLLIKPDVSHLLTYPDCFTENETYVPVQWDLSDLEEKLEAVLKNPDDHREIALKGYHTFLAEYNNGERFVEHFMKMVQ